MLRNLLRKLADLNYFFFKLYYRRYYDKNYNREHYIIQNGKWQ